MNQANRPEQRRYIRAVLRANGVNDVDRLEIISALEIMAILVCSGTVPPREEFDAVTRGVPVAAEEKPRDPERSLEALMKGM